MRKYGQIAIEKEEEELSAKKEPLKKKKKIELSRWLFYGGVLVFSFVLLFYSYKLIVQYNNFYNLINTYYSTGGENNILVSEPHAGQLVRLTFLVRGKVRLFQNKLCFQVRNISDGRLLYQKTAKVKPPEDSQFSDFREVIEILNFTLEPSENILLELYLESEGGKISNLITIPLQLQIE